MPRLLPALCSCKFFPEWSLTRTSLNDNLRAVDVFAYTGWVLSEVLVVGITLAATHHHKALAGAIGRGRRTLSAVLFQDGACMAERVRLNANFASFHVQSMSSSVILSGPRPRLLRVRPHHFSCPSLLSDLKTLATHRRTIMLLNIAQLIVNLFCVRPSATVLPVTVPASEKDPPAPAPLRRVQLCEHRTDARRPVRAILSPRVSTRLTRST